MFKINDNLIIITLIKYRYNHVIIIIYTYKLSWKQPKQVIGGDGAKWKCFVDNKLGQQKVVYSILKVYFQDVFIRKE